MSREEGKAILYAVCAEVYAQRVQRWATDITYVHAVDTPHAKYQYVTANRGKRYRIIAVAPVVGYHVEDREGMILSV